MKKIILISALIIITSHNLRADNTDIVEINDSFYNKLKSEQVILRDEFLRKNYGRTISGSGEIQTAFEYERYGKKLLITLIDKKALKQKFDIIYYLFADKNSERGHIITGGIADFRGKFIQHTPLNSTRNHFIFDVILEENSLIIK